MRHKNKTISGVDFHPSSSLKFMMHISFRYKLGLNIYAGKLRIYDPMWVLILIIIPLTTSTATKLI